MPSESAFLPRHRQIFFTCLSVFLVMLGCGVTLWKAIFADGPSRHLDTAWLIAGTNCLFNGMSPYDIDNFTACWADSLSQDYMAPFVFPPGIFLLSFPMGLLPEAGARLYWSAIGAATVPLLALALWQVARVTAVDGPARLLRACWVTLGVSIGGTAGALYVGQPSVLVALGICLVHLGLRDSRAAVFLTGAVLCSLKPHLSLIWFVVAVLMPPARLARAKGLLAGLVLLAAAALTLADPQIFSDYLHALEVHAGSATSKLARAELLYGLPGLLDWGRSHPRGIAILAVALVISAAAGRALARRRPAQCDWSIPMLAGACLAGAFVSAHKGYDFAVYALVLALAAHLPRTVQTLLLVPALLIWRPALLDLLPVPGTANHVVLVDAVLACSAGFLILYGLGQRPRSQQSPVTAPVVPRI
ncbi:hypothetical protein A6024_16535 [Rhodovulum sulfidophilum]|nr:glycosyltransferase 87 family protein [Rhodovulum sulfidophilum]ANB35556.1 hypothetical protein A6W98_16680 [Rhodovulum sulfidophilum DSM 1374]ANB39377.1 hypothetical protein A6024_16535 [Rhodovulum sulfidophilum]